MLRYLWSEQQLPHAFLAISADVKTQSHKTLEVVKQYNPLDDWIAALAGTIQCEAEPLDVSYRELETCLRQTKPLIISIEHQFLIILQAKKNHAVVLCTDGELQKVRYQQILAYVRRAQTIDGKPLQAIAMAVGGSTAQQQALLHALIEEQQAEQKITNIWCLSPALGLPLMWHIKHSGLLHLAILCFLGLLLAQGLMLVSWLLIGRAALEQSMTGWGSAWVLALISMIFVQGFFSWSQQLIALRFGSLLKRRLLYGILQLHADKVQHYGSGRFMGIVMEVAEVLENFLTTGGLALVMVLAQSVVVVVLAIYSFSLLIPCLVLLLCWQAYWLSKIFQQALPWFKIYQCMGSQLIERMTGHRTRLVQQKPSHWHDEEDQQLANYTQSSMALDQATIMVLLARRLWLLVAGSSILLLAWFDGYSTAELGIDLLIVLIISQALTTLEQALESLRDTWLSGRQMADLMAATQHSPIPESRLAPPNHLDKAQPLLSGNNVHFSYANKRILDHSNFSIMSQDRVLLQGASGSGKSTLAELISGMRLPQQGQLVLRNMPQSQWSLGAWRQRIVSAPQFHQNRVFADSFLFNLLMGKCWPPTAQDTQQAHQLCHRLGLGPLIDRMPGGLYQMVGECGWVLSHGEQSRLFMARALLQQPDLIILDESFAALDPETLQQVMQCVLDEAPTLIVIAHP